MSIADKGYAHPDALVSTEWVAAHLQDPGVRLVESNEDPLVYPSGHIPGAVQVDWTTDLNDPLRRDYITAESFAGLMSRLGVTPDTTIVFYGDRNNWWATYAYWVFQLFGHDKARIMDGGRIKWVNEGRPLTRDVPSYPASDYRAPERDDHRIRAFRDEVLRHVEAKGRLIDVRSPAEYTGERIHMPEYPNEGALRGGHIPGAANRFFQQNLDADKRFKPAAELRADWEATLNGVPPQEAVMYCGSGVTACHNLLALEVAGLPGARIYPGSWSEWSADPNRPVERA